MGRLFGDKGISQPLSQQLFQTRRIRFCGQSRGRLRGLLSSSNQTVHFSRWASPTHCTYPELTLRSYHLTKERELPMNALVLACLIAQTFAMFPLAGSESSGRSYRVVVGSA